MNSLIGITDGASKGRNALTSVRVCSDPLMTSPQEQRSNLRWLADLLIRPIVEATGLPTSPLSSGETALDAFSRRGFFAEAGHPYDVDAVQMWYDDEALAPASLDLLAAAGLGAGTLVVGYELSAPTRRLLDRLGVTYVDIWLHPIRFYEDVLFAIRSNNRDVHERIGEYHVPDAQLRLYADRLKIQAYMGWRRDEANIPSGSSAFIGQTLKDKTVCRDGRMLSLVDFLPEFDALGERTMSRAGQVFYQRHPFQRRGDEHILRAVSARPWAVLSNLPTYALLAHPDIEELMTVSSSAAQEARFFDKTATMLFDPVVRFDDPMAPDQFHTVCQDFVSPHFWAHVLSPATKTNAVRRVGFLDPKDKVRDMLGFYWSWRQIDKLENVRADMSEQPTAEPRSRLDRPISETLVTPRPDFNGFTNSKKAMAAVKRRLQDAEVVSFDVFETLIERVLERPHQLFHFLRRDADRELDGAVPAFVKARRASRGWAGSDMRGEEVSLAARYDAIGRRHGLSTDQVRWLMENELDWERRTMRARACGLEAFKHAKSRGKRIILMSDTYFDRSFVEELLTACGYEGWDELYASSEIGLLKATGRLFEHVAATEGVAPDRILHVGDNFEIDLKRGREAGFATQHMPSTCNIARRVSPLMRLYDEIDDPLAAAAIKGLVARRVAGEVRDPAPGFTQGSARTLGYAVLGPMFLGFAIWLLQSAKRDGRETLFFLSRDGDIVKRCYDVLAALDPHAPASQYVLASRRALGVATLASPSDLKDRSNIPFSSCLLSELLPQRFSIEWSALPTGAARRSGFASDDPTISWPNDCDALASLVADPAVGRMILEAASGEAEALRAWYSAEGFVGDRARRGALVDIGHRGSLQKALRRVLETPELPAYYFVTYDKIEENVPDAATATAGWLADRLPRNASSYRRHFALYETVFLNEAGSFVKIVEEGGSLRPEFLDAEGDETRRAFSRHCHAGVMDFCKDVIAAFGDAVLEFQLRPDDAALAFAAMLDHPYPLDAKVWTGVVFEDHYSGRGLRHIVPAMGTPEQRGLWKQGAAQLSDQTALAKAGSEPRRNAGLLNRLLRRGRTAGTAKTL